MAADGMLINRSFVPMQPANYVLKANATFAIRSYRNCWCLIRSELSEDALAYVDQSAALSSRSH